MTSDDVSDKNALYNRLGGKEAIRAAVYKMYEKILQDPLLKPFFAGLDMTRLYRSQQAFLLMAFGGPHHYTGEDLSIVHAKMVKEKGLSDVHFNAVAGHLKSTLSELNVPGPVIAEVLAIVETTRGAVLGGGKK